ncbi:MAG: sodium:proton antiporter NhaD [Chloroflexota bacterium]|nr:sodium:proton antiporter NhaD [Chloroflexota bacterium]
MARLAPTGDLHRPGSPRIPDGVTVTASVFGLVSLLLFAGAYAVAMAEERLHVRKSVPVLIGAALIWMLVGTAYTLDGRGESAAELARHAVLEFAELLLFLIPAMTYVNTLEDRGLFDGLRAWLVGRGFSLRAIFWLTGALAFWISPFADNLTTALLVGAIAMSVGRDYPRFVPLACINIVVAANAGGAFSPFGDITTLMVWQAGVVDFLDFFALLIPALVNWLVPAMFMSLAIGNQRPTPIRQQSQLQPGTLVVLCLFLATIVLTVSVHALIKLPPALGMMAGLGMLKGYSYLLSLRHRRRVEPIDEMDDVFASAGLDDDDSGGTAVLDEPATLRATTVTVRARPLGVSASTVTVAPRPLDIFALLEKIEWDTLLFFYGVLLGVGGLGAFGYLALTSEMLYGGGHTGANVAVGLLSAVVDNVPVMFAVLTMQPSMAHGQWLLVTLTTGVGGSLLSIGSAAGVALMGQARGVYTFIAHLRWAWAVALGYLGSILAHLLINRGLF